MNLHKTYHIITETLPESRKRPPEAKYKADRAFFNSGGSFEAFVLFGCYLVDNSSIIHNEREWITYVNV